MTGTILLNKEYLKIPPNTTAAKLIEVIKTNTQRISETFIKYNTEYLGYYGKTHHTLPQNRDIIILLLQTNQGAFTEIIEYTQKTETYYKRNLGKIFKIEIKKKEENKQIEY